MSWKSAEIILEVVLKEHKEFNEWGAMLLSKQVRGLQNVYCSLVLGSGASSKEEEEKSEQPKVHIEASLKVNPNDFVPISVLGKGSFGEVYLVEKNYKELFAMKVLSKQKIMGNNYIKYAMTERNVLSYTHHPFIVKPNYSFQTSKKLFLILDYCPGGDLGKLLAKKGKIDESLA